MQRVYAIILSCCVIVFYCLKTQGQKYIMKKFWNMTTVNWYKTKITILGLNSFAACFEYKAK